MSDLNSLNIMMGKCLVTDNGIDIEKYYSEASNGVNNYVVEEAGDSLTQLEIIDTAMRVVLVPHHKEIDKLKELVGQLLIENENVLEHMDDGFSDSEYEEKKEEHLIHERLVKRAQEINNSTQATK